MNSEMHLSMSLPYYLQNNFIYRIGLIFVLIFGFSLEAADIKENKLKLIRGKVKFISKAPKLEFAGIGKEIQGYVDLKNKRIHFILELNSFKTGIKLRDEHLRENYLETEKYPTAEFSGLIKTYDPKTGIAEAAGKLKLHGEEKDNFLIKGKVEKTDGTYRLTSNFSVLLKDFKIEIPRVVFLELSNEIKIETEFILAGEP